MSTDHQIHIRNNTAELIYVLPSPNVDFIWADIGFQAASTAVISICTAGFGATATAGGLINSIRSVAGLRALVSVARTSITAGGIYSNTVNWSRVVNDAVRKDALKALAEAKSFLHEKAIKVPPATAVRVFDTNVWNPLRYVTPSGVASAFDASDMSLFIANESLTWQSLFNTNSDFSWIVGKTEIVRAKYGTLQEESRGDGYYRIALANSLFSGQSLLPGQCLNSPNGNYDLVYDADGRLVLFERDRPKGDRCVWASTPDTKPAGSARMQDDGNFVLYGPANQVTWATNQYGVGEDFQYSALRVEDSGKLVIYKKDNSVLWSSAP